MGETYKGLTIRIGADTTNLAKALQNVASVAKTTQSQLRKVEQGLRFDPTSAVMLGAKIETVEQRMLSLSAKAALCGEAIGRIDDDAALSKLRDGTKNAAFEAEMALQHYNRLDNELAILRNHLKDYHQEAGLEYDDKAQTQDLIAALRESDEAMRRHKDDVDALERQYYGLRDAREAALKDLESWKIVAQAKDAAIEIGAVKAECRQLSGELVKAGAQARLLTDAGFTQLSEQLTRAHTAADSLMDDLSRLDKALEIDPTNLQTLALRSKAFSDALETARLELDDTERKLRRLESMGALKDPTKDARVLAVEFEEAAANAAELANRLSDVKGRLEAARQIEKDLVEQLNRGVKENDDDYSRAEEELRKVRVEVSKLENEMRDLDNASEKASRAYDSANIDKEAAEARIRVAELTAAIKELENREREASRISREMANSFRNIGQTMYGTITMNMAMVGRQLIDQAREVDSAYRDMRKTVDGTEEQFVDLRQAAIDYSLTHVTSAQEMLEMQALGGQMGVAVENLEAFSRVASNLTIATDIGAEDVALELGQMSNVMHMSTGDLDGFGDALVRLGNNMPAQESAIMNVTSRIASMGTICGFTQDEILGWATAIAATGQKSESAGTAIARTMSNIESAVSTGGDELDAFARIAGMSADEFARAWRETPSAAMQAFIGGLRQIDLAGGSVDQTLKELGINGVRQKQAIMGLTQTYTILGDALTMSHDAFNGITDSFGAAGDAAREADQKSQGLSGTMGMLSNSVAAFGDAFGTAALPYLNAALAVVQSVTKAFKDAPPALQQFVIVTGALVGAAGPLIVGLSVIARAADDLKLHMQQMAAARLLDTQSTAAHTAAAVADAAAIEAENAASGGTAAVTAKAAAGKGASAASSMALAAAEKTATVSTRVLGVAMKALPFVAIAAGVATLVTALVSFASEAYKAARAQDPFYAAIDDLSERSQAAIEKGEQFKKTYGNDAGPADVSAIKGLEAEYMELMSIEDRTYSQEHRLGVVRRQLAGYSSELADSLEHAATAEEHRLAIEAEIQSRENSARDEAYIQAVTQKAENDRLIAEERAALDEIVRRGLESGTITDDGTYVGWGVQREVREHQEHIAQLEEQNKEYQRSIDGYVDTLEEAERRASAVDLYNAGARDESVFADYGYTLEEVEEFANEAARIAQEAADDVRNEMIDAMDTLVSGSPAISAALANMGMSTEELADHLIAAGVSSEDFASRVESSVSRAIDAFNQLSYDQDKDLAAYTDGLWNNIAVMQDWGNNVTALYSGIQSNEAFDQFVRQGPEYAGVVVAELARAVENGEQILYDGMYYWPQEFVDLIGTAAVAAAEAETAVLVAQGRDIAASASDIGEGVAEGVAGGLSRSTGSAEGAMTEYKNAMMRVVDGLPREMLAAGVAAGTSFNSGLGSAQRDAGATASALASAVRNSLAGLGTDAYSYGDNVGKGFYNGMSSWIGNIGAVANQMADAASSNLANRLYIKSPSRLTMKYGEYFGEGFAIGITKETADVVARASGMADRAAAAMEYDPSYFANMAGETAYRATEARTRALTGYGDTTNNSASTYNLYVDGELMAMNGRLRDAVYGVIDELVTAGEM